MRAKDIRRLIALLTTLLAIGISLLSTEESPPVETTEGIPTYVVSGSTGQQTRALVERTVDGDTIVVRIDGVKHTVRFIGLNAPESVDPRRADQCFSHEASEYMRSLTEGATVILIADESQGDIDKYGRLLRYVEKDGVDIAAQMINDGYAFEYTYKGAAYDRQTEYDIAEENAAEAKRGLWAADTCSGTL
jgi:micrococcal nuclease